MPIELIVTTRALEQSQKESARTFTSINYVLLYVARGGAIGRGTALRAGRSWARFLMASLEFSLI